MSLVGTLNVAKSALAVNATAVQTTGNNLANANTEGYTRQRADLAPARGQRIGTGQYVGGGVNVTAIRRQIDDALTARLRGGVSEEAAADVKVEWLGRAESIMQELGDNDLSSGMSAFFGAWSELANKPQDLGLREIVVQEGQNLAGKFRQVGGDLKTLAADADVRLEAEVEAADTLAARVADYNKQINQAEIGGRVIANDLRDARDQAVKELSELVSVNSRQNDDGTLDLFVASEPLVLGQRSFGLEAQVDTDGRLDVRTRDGKAALAPRGRPRRRVAVGPLADGADAGRPRRGSPGRLSSSSTACTPRARARPSSAT